MGNDDGFGFRTVAVIEPHDFTVEPDVEGVTMFQNPATRTVKIGYNLTDVDKIVTLAIETNTAANASGDWIALPEQAISSVYGDVNRIVKHGASSKWIYWNPDEAFADELIASGAARAIVTTWATNTPPNYMVVDLTGNSIVRYYTSTNAIPDGGLANPIYRRRYMVFRKIPAKDIIWTMGVVTNIGDNVSGWKYTVGSTTTDNLTPATPHKVKLTYDYYLAIYELTRAQFDTIYGAKYGYSGTWIKDNFSYQDTLPAGGLYYDVYSNFKATTIDMLNSVDWYEGQCEFKILSEAEWEFACRAGEPRILYSGESFNLANLQKIAQGTLSEGGLLPCNRWGLYDMLGNAAEVCRDKMTSSERLYWQSDAGYLNNGYITDPEGLNPEEVAAGTKTVTRGFMSGGIDYRAVRGDYYSTIQDAVQNSRGTRLVCPIHNAAEE